MKKWFQKLLSAIEAANRKNFGEGKMDCCELSKKDKQKSKAKKI